MADLPVASVATAPPEADQRQAQAWSSPVGMAIIIPLLVLITGLSIGVVCRAPLRHGAEVTAAQTFALSSERIRHRVSTILGQASPMLDALRALVFSQPPWDDDQAIATALLGIIRGRPGATLIGWSANDGTHLHVDVVGQTYRFQRNRVSSDGQTPANSWTLSDEGRLTQPIPLAHSAYDARSRPFYLSAMATKTRTWTDPYLFYSSTVTGISCAEPINLGTTGAGVMSVDFDLTSISALLDSINHDELSTSFLFTKEQVLLGLPSAWRSAIPPATRLLTVQDLRIADLQHYFTALPPLPRDDGETPLFELSLEGEPGSASVSAIQLPGGPTWYLGTIIRRSALLGESDYYLNLSLVIGLIILSLATAIAWWFAGHLTRSRLAIVHANNRAVQAEAKANELGAYRLIKVLGKGGMGDVWLAQHLLLARPAAIKLIKANTLEGSEPERQNEIRQRFAAEARITANLHSRNTIELYDYGIAQDGTYYYVMELLDGIDLFDLVGKFGPLPAARVVHLLIQACNSLAEAHDHGLVHRDIKPENLYTCRLSDEVDVLKVLDFGIVRMQQRSPDMPRTRAGLVQGTPATMSPEQATDQPLDGRSDLYSLGCVGYWLLTGYPVFDGDNAVKILTQHVHTAPKPPSTRTQKQIPAALDAFILMLLAKDPAKRPANARDCAAILRNLDMCDATAWDEATQQAWWLKHLPPRKIIIPDDVPPQLFAPGQRAK